MSTPLFIIISKMDFKVLASAAAGSLKPELFQIVLWDHVYSMWTLVHVLLYMSTYRHFSKVKIRSTQPKCAEPIPLSFA